MGSTSILYDFDQFKSKSISVHAFRSHFGHWLEPLFGPTLFDLKSWTESCVRITISVHDCGPKLDLWPHNFGPRPWTEICCPFLISVHGRGPKSFGPQNFGPRPWTELCWPFLISVHDCGPKSFGHPTISVWWSKRHQKCLQCVPKCCQICVQSRAHFVCTNLGPEKFQIWEPEWPIWLQMSPKWPQVSPNASKWVQNCPIWHRSPVTC